MKKQISASVDLALAGFLTWFWTAISVLSSLLALCCVCLLLSSIFKSSFSSLSSQNLLKIMIMECCYNTNPLQFRRYDLCRVKFGVPLDQVCKKDIPGPLLVSWFIFQQKFRNIWKLLQCYRHRNWTTYFVSQLGSNLK